VGPRPRLFLVKHAAPVQDRARPSREWVLGDEGRAGAARLGARLAGEQIARMFSSPEPKAAETAEIIAAALSVPVDAAVSVPVDAALAVPVAVPVDVEDGLREQERAGAPYMDGAAFRAAIRELFARPGERVFGEESADAAHARFGAAMDRAIARADASSIAVVSHGTVMALFIARRNGLDPFALWQSLGLPSCAVLSLPELRLLDVIHPPA
jgi:broad specificity phosphatase PhoE